MGAYRARLGFPLTQEQKTSIRICLSYAFLLSMVLVLFYSYGNLILFVMGYSKEYLRLLLFILCLSFLQIYIHVFVEMLFQNDFLYLLLPILCI